MGFWQITARQCRAARSVNSRCESGRVTMSAKSACSASSIAAASVYQRAIRCSAANASARPGSGSATADEFDAVNALPGLGLKLREEAGADHHAFQRMGYPWVHRII